MEKMKVVSFDRNILTNTACAEGVLIQNPVSVSLYVSFYADVCVLGGEYAIPSFCETQVFRVDRMVMKDGMLFITIVARDCFLNTSGLIGMGVVLNDF